MVFTLLTNLPESNGRLWKNFHPMNLISTEGKSYLIDHLRMVTPTRLVLRMMVWESDKTTLILTTKKNKVVTLEGAINDCRVKNGEKPLSYFKGKELAHVSAYMAYTSRGNVFNIQIPNTKEALDAYEDGKRLYFTKKGQLNFSCADCHVYQTGTKLRADIPSPAIGHPTHFPVYRSGMGRLVTLHERFAGCLNRIRAKSFKGGSDELNNLEFFTTFMSNGLEVNGPGSRK